MGLFKGLPGNDSYLKGENGGSFIEDTSLTNNWKIAMSIKVQCVPCTVALPHLSSFRFTFCGHQEPQLVFRAKSMWDLSENSPG